MGNAQSFYYRLGILVAAAVMGGCGNGSTPAAGTIQQLAPAGISSARFALARQHAGDKGKERSWMASGASKKTLLYVTNYDFNDVSVFSYPKGKLEGTLTGFQLPAGECSDKAGNVFIANFLASQIVEYAHGGTSPIATLSDPGEYPVGCAVDPTTGNLAVTNQLTTNYSPGDLLIFPNASGTPKTYTSANFYYYFFCTYDSKGNLYIDGLNGSSAGEYAELPAGGSYLKSITLDQNIYPLGIQWDGKYLAIGAQSVEQVYGFKISGSTGTLKRTTNLSGATEVTQFWIQKGKRHKSATLIGPDYGEGHDVDYWHYPSGGYAFKTLQGLDGPFGVAISAAK
jgi:hypothetical protein